MSSTAASLKQLTEFHSLDYMEYLQKVSGATNDTVEADEAAEFGLSM